MPTLVNVKIRNTAARAAAPMVKNKKLLGANSLLFSTKLSSFLRSSKWISMHTPYSTQTKARYGLQSTTPAKHSPLNIIESFLS